MKEEEAACTIADDSDYNSAGSSSSVNDPVLVRSKGQPRSTRIKSGIENSKKKKKVVRRRSTGQKEQSHSGMGTQVILLHSVMSIQ